MSAYYNENDKYCAQWLRNLIKAGVIADGEVDERSIEDIKPNELSGFTQIHMFAGIGIWSYALRQAGWPDDRKVWTGSCPCQPFSAAGKRVGFVDERHLWPAWYHNIQQQKPDVIFGEQVASDDGIGWLRLVQSDLEDEGYSFAGLDLPACGFGAPHIRQRLYFVADGMVDTNMRSSIQVSRSIGKTTSSTIDNRSNVSLSGQFNRTSDHVRGLANSGSERSQGWVSGGSDQEWAMEHGSLRCRGSISRTFWEECDWLYCKDGKYRPVEPGTFPLVDGSAGRVGPVRAYGNALCSETAIGFIRSFLETENLRFELNNLI